MTADMLPLEQPIAAEILRRTSDVVAAFVRHNALSSNDLPALIQSVHASLRSIAQDTPPPNVEALRPAIPIRKSVTDAYIVCLEDGRKLKMLKRYLRCRYGLSPDEYRTKWDLPKDYPMVAPNYALQRSQFAKKIGLGRQQTRKAGSRLSLNRPPAMPRSAE